MDTITEAEIYFDQPKVFCPKLTVSACRLEYNDKLLLLKRSVDKTEGNLWEFPTGKIKTDETPLEAIIRETYEETGIQLTPIQITLIDKLYIKKPYIDYTSYLFKAILAEMLPIIISTEHQEYKWITFEDTFNFPLVSGTKEALEKY